MDRISVDAEAQRALQTREAVVGRSTPREQGECRSAAWSGRHIAQKCVLSPLSKRLGQKEQEYVGIVA